MFEGAWRSIPSPSTSLALPGEWTGYNRTGPGNLGVEADRNRGAGLIGHEVPGSERARRQSWARIRGRRHQVAGRSKLTDESCSVPSRAAGQLTSLEKHHAFHPALRQVVGDTASNDAAADDHDAGLVRRQRHSRRLAAVPAPLPRPRAPERLRGLGSITPPHPREGASHAGPAFAC